ncbi:MAG: hypothetical protein JWN96_3688, partial [Mycobacterium sp.]|nr:hypothetical protein [Mycobacterium sp.]
TPADLGRREATDLPAADEDGAFGELAELSRQIQFVGAQGIVSTSRRTSFSARTLSVGPIP